MASIFIGILFSLSGAFADYVPGEVLVKFKSQEMATFGSATLSAKKTMYQYYKVKSVYHFSKLSEGLERWVLAEGTDIHQTIQALGQNSYIQYAQPNYILSIPKNPISALDGDGEFPLPCIPGLDIPDCDPTLCWMPGLPIPPGCKDWELPGLPGFPGDPDEPGGPGNPPVEDPALEPVPPQGAPQADPRVGELWGLEKIQASKAWQIQKGSKNILVADIDTGIDYNHEDLAANVWRNPDPNQKDKVGYDFIHDDGLPFDDQGHGSHTAGTIGATGENGKGVSGVSPVASIIAAKFLSSQGQGSTDGAVQSIDYALSKGAKILSNSWGGPAEMGNDALLDSVKRARAKGVLFIAAAGNETNDNDKKPTYPAAYTEDNMITVAATGPKDELAFFSNWGATTTHLGAPGMNIVSSFPKGAKAKGYDGSGYYKANGTSMACPHVAGAAAVVWAANPTWDYKQVKAALLSSVDAIESLQGKSVTGGRLNLYRALGGSTD